MSGMSRMESVRNHVVMWDLHPAHSEQCRRFTAAPRGRKANGRSQTTANVSAWRS